MESQIQKINALKEIDFHSEDDVIVKYVIPFFRHFGYTSDMFNTKVPIQEYRANKQGRKPEADCVFYSMKEHNDKTSLIVVETKRDEGQSPNVQAKYYSDNLYVPIFLTWQKYNFEIFQCKKFESPISLGKFELGNISNEDFTKLVEILSPQKIVNYCEKNEIKTIDFEDERKKIENKYLNNVYNHLKDSHFLDLSRSLNIVDGFVQLYLSDYSQSNSDYEEIEKIINSGVHAKYIQESLKKSTVFYTLDNLIQQIETIAILGDPGSGKTTLLKHICIENCLAQSNLLPVFLSIRDIFASNSKITDAIENEIRCKGVTDNPELLSEFSIKYGRLLLCLDGFDEIDIQDPLAARNSLKDISSQLMEIHYRNPKNIIIISARTESWKECRKEIHPIFKEYEIFPFSKNNIRVFVTKWFEGAGTDLRDDLLDEFRHLGWPEFASNPLLLALTCYVFERKRKLSHRMHNLYDKCIDLLLEEWATSRRISKRVIVKELNSDTKKDILTEIALAFHSRGKATFTRNELILELEAQLEKFGISSKKAGDVFEEFVSQHGLLKSWSFDGYYAFPHLVFQEFLTAKALREKPDGFKDLIRHKDEPFWSNTLKIYSSMGDLAPFLAELLQHEDNLLHTNLYLAASCLSEGTKLSDIKLRDTLILQLLELARGENIFFSEKAIDLLVKIGDDRSNLNLIESYTNNEGHFNPKKYAFKYMLKLEGAKRYLDLLDFVLNDNVVRGYEIEALNWLGHKQLLQGLQYIIDYHGDNLSSKIISRKNESIRLLVTVGQEEALPILIAIIKNRELYDRRIFYNLISSLTNIRNPKIQKILEQIIQSDWFSIDEKIAATRFYGIKSPQNKNFLLSISLDNSVEEGTRQIALLSFRILSNFELSENDLDSFQKIINNTTLKDWRAQTITAKLIREIGGEKARSIIENAIDLWQNFEHPHKEMIVNSLKLELLRFNEEQNIETILELFEKNTKLPLEWDLPKLVYIYYIKKPKESLEYFTRLLDSNRTSTIDYFKIQGAIVENMNRIHLNLELLSLIISYSKKMQKDKWIWKKLFDIWNRQELDPEIRKLFY